MNPLQSREFIPLFCVPCPLLLQVRVDPRRYTGRMRIGTALALKDAMVDIKENAAAEMRVPMVIYHGSADQVGRRGYGLCAP